MSAKQSYIDRINSNTTAALGLNVDDFIDEAISNNAQNSKSEIDSYSAGMDSQIANTQSYYDKQIGDTKTEYESKYERNAVQKLINEKQIAEKNANLGLTDSGLNRTQQTAVQLSYANQKGDIDLARQSALDNLTLAMTDAITKLTNQKQSGIMDIENKWNDISTQQGTDAYNAKLGFYKDLITADTEELAKIEEAEIDAAAEVQKAQIGASAKQLGEKINVLNSKNSTLGNLQGSFASNGITSIHNADGSTTYTDTVTGISVTMDAGINPFTGQNNLTENTETAKSAQKYGTFSNGYQPKGIIGYGVLSRAFKNSDNTYLGYECNGRNSTIWKATDKNGNTHYFFWDGNNNEYIEMSNEQVEAAKKKQY